jgi:hypothetical protein
MIQETMISKDGDFGKHCLEIWQLCFAISFFHKNPLYELHWISFLLSGGKNSPPTPKK